tara:strand:+ start:335 stop:550 length:216 start_codon:yes stop_codon:yes gene_type:complete
MKLISTYWSEDRTRRADIVMTEKGFEVALYKDEEYLYNVAVHEHSEVYAESAAENFVNDIGWWCFEKQTNS